MLEQVDFVNLSFLEGCALMRLSSLCCQGLLLRMAHDGLCSLVLSCLTVCSFPVWLVWTATNPLACIMWIVMRFVSFK